MYCWCQDVLVAQIVTWQFLQWKNVASTRQVWWDRPLLWTSRVACIQRCSSSTSETLKQRMFRTATMSCDISIWCLEPYRQPLRVQRQVSEAKVDQLCTKWKCGWTITRMWWWRMRPTSKQKMLVGLPRAEDTHNAHCAQASLWWGNRSWSMILSCWLITCHWAHQLPSSSYVLLF